MLLKRTLTETKHPNPPAGYRAPESDDLQYTTVFSTRQIIFRYTPILNRVHRPLASDHGEQHPEDGKRQLLLISVQQ